MKGDVSLSRENQHETKDSAITTNFTHDHERLNIAGPMVLSLRKTFFRNKQVL